MKSLALVARIVIGLAFVFSGTVKAIDPLGSTYKFQDYFHAFDISFLVPLSLPLAILLCLAEFIAGFSILAGVKQKAGITLVMLLMVIFTPLTLVLALTNPVSDCGCFGDAIHLTNWQTFWKNVVLIALALILFLNRKKIKEPANNARQWMIIAGASVLFILFSLYNLIFLPVIDFLPYKEGVKIADQMVIPEGASPDRYETTFIYEKDGVQKEFDLTNYPADDTTWVFIDQKSVLAEKGYQPPIHDFTITNISGEDLTDRILSSEGRTVFMIARRLTDTNEKRLQEGFRFGQICMNNGIDFYVLTATGTDGISRYENGLPFCNVDETTLKTMVRANPGYMLLENGVIKEKWSWANLPGSGYMTTLNEK